MNRMKPLGRVSLALLCIAAAATNAPAQYRPDVSTARISYNLMKNQLKPQGAVPENLAALEKAMDEAAQAGRSGEVRRLLAQATVLLQGQEWTDEREFSSSLVLRGEETCLDSSRPAAFRLEQIYPPSLRFQGAPTARMALHKRILTPQGFQRGDKILDIPTPGGLSRDLIDEPFRFELEVKTVPDGTYILRAEILDQDKPVGVAGLTVDLRSGLAARLASIESDLSKVRGFEDRRPDVLYPLEYIRSMNRGKRQIGSFPVADRLAAAESILASLKAGRDPLAGKTGDIERHYRLDGADEILPYRVYVPTKFDGRTAYPLIIALHGLGGSQADFFDGYDKRLPPLAEARGYLVAAPSGFGPDGFYGMVVPGSATDPATLRKLEYSEKDVLAVLARMRKDYAVDASRIYLMGHSMGAIGTWHLGAKYPDIWAALAPFAGFGNPATVAAMKNIPEIVFHGSADALLPVAFSQAMVAEMKRLNVEHKYVEIAGGDHNNIVAPNLAAALDFFDAHRKKTP
jgi:poly(3-hydroxybutyrate) depolymerase